MRPFNNKHHQRRQVLKSALLAPLGVLGIPELSIAKGISEKPQPSSDSLTVVFQGDSITDAGRDRSRYYANDPGGMGGGYVRLIVTELLASQPKDHIRCYNRGISGNKVYQLAGRWEDDCLQLKPQVLSILIGVNDFWHTLSSGYEGTPKIFDQDLRQLLNRTFESIPDLKLILGEPFAVKGGRAITEAWKDKFPPYQEIVRQIANDFNAPLVPYQKVFDEALELAPVSHWCPDGVHPSMAGASLMKDAWLKAYREIM